MDLWPVEHGAGARFQIGGVQYPGFRPLLQDVMHRRSAPGRSGIGIDRVKPCEPQYAPGVECERIGLQPVHIGDGDDGWANRCRRRGCGAAFRVMDSGRIEGTRQHGIAIRHFPLRPRHSLQS